MGDSEAGWQQVRRKGKGSKEEQKKPRGKGITYPNTSFFVSNLPSECSSKELREAFQEFGEVVDAYVAMKKDKSGSYFGFVRFPPLENVKEMERRLNRVVIGNLKVSVNLAKFDKDGSMKVYQYKQPTFVPHSGMKGMEQQWVNDKQQTWANNFTSNGRSFKDVILISRIQTTKKEIHLNSFRPQALAVWGNSVVIGRTKDFQSLCCLGEWVLKINGYRGLRYLGGLYVMIQFKDQLHANKLISETNTWEDWFSKLYVWEGKSIPYERIAWLKVYGVPPMLWDPIVINQLGGKMGKLLLKSEASLQDQNLSQDCLAVLVSDGEFIHEPITIRWEGKAFICWLVEDTRAWAPDFVNDVGPVPESSSGKDNPNVN
ncbi:hypothetical protein E3N88_12832 [Mikania micrantha]|uniref:RRM domain-containing protein n=1 Tax=Mikania micrantha TaxID=192012 RepID=A0A5N6P725_9ASTR|nr:hypothetical protein E3N88_12832 [Mikania micrantha]